MKKHVNAEACLKKKKRHKDMTTVFKTSPRCDFWYKHLKMLF